MPFSVVILDHLPTVRTLAEIQIAVVPVINRIDIFPAVRTMQTPHNHLSNQAKIQNRIKLPKKIVQPPIHISRHGDLSQRTWYIGGSMFTDR